MPNKEDKREGPLSKQGIRNASEAIWCSFANEALSAKTLEAKVAYYY